MFSFHKPKIYRSLKGCCICRAKSSSSRFTDSKRYEADFEKCFRITEKRTGEICNACVLLVKRWKKLPPGSNRNWHHVVDARAGPGTKSIMKMKNRNREEQRIKKKHKHRKQLRHNKPPQSPGGLSDDVIIGDDYRSDDSRHSDGTSPIASDLSDDESSVLRHSQNTKSRSGRRKKHHSKPMRFSSFLDLTYWKKTEICCGIIFKGANGEVLVDTKLLRPCRTCKPLSPQCSVSDDLLALSPDPPTEGAQQPMDHEDVPSPPPLASATSSEDSCDAVLDLSMPHRRKNSPLEDPSRCIDVEV